MPGAGCEIASGQAPACVLLASPGPDPRVLRAFDVAIGDEVRLRYVHSVTKSPVEERYRVEDAALLQTEIRFSEHGPGLPTEADAAPGTAWTQEDGQFVVRHVRRLDAIAARVDPAQSPQLVAAGQTIDLAPAGPRSLRLQVVPGRCPPPPPRGSE